jgi:hypothetical protein
MIKESSVKGFRRNGPVDCLQSVKVDLAKQLRRRPFVPTATADKYSQLYVIGQQS